MFTIGASTFSIASTIAGAFIFVALIGAGLFVAYWEDMKEARLAKKAK